jgi:hypothetical protein
MMRPRRRDHVGLVLRKIRLPDKGIALLCAPLARGLATRNPKMQMRPTATADLEVTSPEQGMSIRRQFTHDWAFKPQVGMDQSQSPKAIEDGLPLTQLKIMKRKADVDFAIGPRRGGWGTPATEPPSLDEFRYRNYRINTYVAEISGKQLAEILTNPDFDRLEIYPPIAEEDLDPEQLYRVVSPENAIWVATRIMETLWKKMKAGPDVLKSDITREVYEIE